MNNKNAFLKSGSVFHIYNRVAGSETSSLSKENYDYFLRKYNQYISPIADTFCFCLMPNHFHFLIRIKGEADILRYAAMNSDKVMTTDTLATLDTLTGFKTLSEVNYFLSQQFSNFFNAYVQAFNRQHKRKGGLFMRPYKRKEVTSDSYFIGLVRYIHLNPVVAGLCKQPADWKYSSYKELAGTGETLLRRGELMIFFGSTRKFIEFHQSNEDTP